MSVREDLLAVLQPALGDDVVVIPYQDALDVPERRTVMFKQLTILPLQAAPRSGYEVRYVLTCLSPHTDPELAEADLDAFVLVVLGTLNPLDWFAWSTADKVLSNGHLAYDVTCWNIAQ